jgi:hypothetical protein
MTPVLIGLLIELIALCVILVLALVGAAAGPVTPDDQ